MGNLTSKIEDVKPDETPSTPVLTSKLRNVPQDFDPRSPSINIVRTPIQVSTPNSGNKPQDEISECNTFNINSPTLKTTNIDPRSPTVDFSRTPIVIADSTKLPSKLHNKNLDNVRKTILSVTPKKIVDMPSYVPPKLLESSPLIIKPNDNKRRSIVGLLETNIDYVETNLDEVVQNKTPIKNKRNTESTSTIELRAKFLEGSTGITTPIDIVKSEDSDPRSPTVEFCRTPIQILRKVGEIDLNEIKQARTSETIDDDGLIMRSSILKHELPNDESSNETEVKITPKVVELTPKLTEKKHKVVLNTNEFDKKINTLIYTDEDAAVVSRVNTNQEQGSRTPLGEHNGQLRKTVPKLKVSDKPRKSEYAVSKIPVFKDKKAANITIQCENTPPKSMSDLINNKALKRAQWDGDNTLII